MTESYLVVTMSLEDVEDGSNLVDLVHASTCADGLCQINWSLQEAITIPSVPSAPNVMQPYEIINCAP